MFTIRVNHDGQTVTSIFINGVSVDPRARGHVIQNIGTLRIRYTSDTGRPVLAVTSILGKPVFLSCPGHGYLSPFGNLMIATNENWTVETWLPLGW